MNTVALLGRLILSLAFVLGLMWLLARKVKRPGRGRNHKLIDVLSRQQLSRSASIAVVRVMDQALILGITDGQVSVIGDTDLDAVQVKLDAEVPAPRRSRRGRPTPAPAQVPLTQYLPTTQVTGGPAHQVPTSPYTPTSQYAPTSQHAPSTEVPLAPVPATAQRGPLAGSALSPDTWRQTLDSLRDLTARTR